MVISVSSNLCCSDIANSYIFRCAMVFRLFIFLSSTYQIKGYEPHMVFCWNVIYTTVKHMEILSSAVSLVSFVKWLHE